MDTKLNTVALLITDWSGVISDDRMPVYEANMRVLEAHGMQRMTFAEWLPKTQLSPREFFAAMGLTEDSDALFREYSEVFAVIRDEGTHPFAYADAKNFFEKIRALNKKIVVLSSHPTEHLHKEADEYGLTGFIDRFVGNAKDKAVGLDGIVLDYNIPKDEALYLGDTIFDIKAAKLAGVPSVGVATGYHIRERLEAEQPTLVVGSLTELLGHIQ
jgi:phosphoglycolate phosphatase-like HAD superfamily hydrolase